MIPNKTAQKYENPIWTKNGVQYNILKPEITGKENQAKINCESSYLKALVFDKFFDAINDENVSIIINVTYISSVEPTFFIDRLLRLFLVLEVTLHHTLAPHTELTRSVLRKRPASVRIYELHLEIRKYKSDRVSFRDSLSFIRITVS